MPRNCPWIKFLVGGVCKAAVPAGSVASRLLQHIFPEVKHRCEGLVHSCCEIPETTVGVWHLCRRQSGSFRKSLLREVLPLSQKVCKEPPCFLNSSKKSLVCDPFFVNGICPDFVNGICPKGYTGVIKPLCNFVQQHKGWQTKYIYKNKMNYSFKLVAIIIFLRAS